MAFEKLQTLSDNIDAMHERIQQLAQSEIKPALEDALKTLRQQIPTLKTITWHQYRPYFNDGDPCIFSVHGVYGQFDGHDSDEDEGEDLDSSFKYFNKDLKLTETQVELLNQFNGLINNLGDGEDSVLLMAFDDSLTIIIDVNTGAVSTEECDHD